MREAAHVCRAVQQQLAGSVMEKEDRSPVTVADFASQALICRTLRAAFPHDPIVAEESTETLREESNAALLQKIVGHIAHLHPEAGSEEVCAWIDYGTGAPARRFWTLDPIDGTKGFLRGEQYAVALALIVDGEVVVAAMACPNLEVQPGRPAAGIGAVFSAISGAGATCTPLAGGAETKVRVNATADPARALYCESVESGHSSHDRSQRVAVAAGFTREPVRLDSQTKYAVVARGEADVYWRFARKDYREKIWDHAAGALVCTEAGGRVTDLEGKSLDFSCGRLLERNRGLIVSNGALHERVLNAVRAADRES